MKEANWPRRPVRLKSRRQHPFGRFILDFFCVSQQLVVEIDGGVYDQAEQREHDLERSAFLEEQGCTVLRFKNAEVEKDIGSVIGAILEQTSPSPQPPPSPD